MNTSFPHAVIHSHHLQVIVASHDMYGQRLDRSVRASCLNEVKALVAGWAGGFSVSFSHGGWINGTGNLIEEPVTIVAGYAEKVVEQHLIEDLVRMLLVQMDQESVALIRDGVLLLFDRTFLDRSAPDRHRDGQRRSSNVFELPNYNQGDRHAS